MCYIYSHKCRLPVTKTFTPLHFTTLRPFMLRCWGLVHSPLRYLNYGRKKRYFLCHLASWDYPSPPFSADVSLIRIYFSNIFALVTCKNVPFFFLCVSCGTYFNVCSLQFVFRDNVTLYHCNHCRSARSYLGVLLVLIIRRLRLSPFFSDVPKLDLHSQCIRNIAIYRLTYCVLSY
jgi:hypothetical protein